MRHERTIPCATILLGLFLLTTAVPASAGEDPPIVLESLVIGFSSATLANVDPDDAKVATKVWADKIIRRKGQDVESGAIILNSLSTLEKVIQEKGVDLVFLLPQEFVKIRNHSPIVPVVISTPSKGIFEQFVLLVRKDSGLETIRDLKNKRLTLETDQKGTLPQMWLETLLMQEGGGERTKPFFASIKATRGASQTVLPVFFRQADGCIVTRHAFDTVVELNPQLGKHLRVIESSPAFVSSIGCLRKDYFEKYNDVLTKQLILLHEDPQGKQLLTLFKKGKLVAFQAAFMETVETLLKEHDDLRLKIAGRK